METIALFIGGHIPHLLFLVFCVITGTAIGRLRASVDSLSTRLSVANERIAFTEKRIGSLKAQLKAQEDGNTHSWAEFRKALEELHGK